MDWKAATELPKPGVKLWGWSTSRGPVVVMLVHGALFPYRPNAYRFIDLNSIPINDIESWSYVVAPDETAG
jgi:hypothetical protein